MSTPMVASVIDMYIYLGGGVSTMVSQFWPRQVSRTSYPIARLHCTLLFLIPGMLLLQTYQVVDRKWGAHATIMEHTSYYKPQPHHQLFNVVRRKVGGFSIKNHVHDVNSR